MRRSLGEGVFFAGASFGTFFKFKSKKLKFKKQARATNLFNPREEAKPAKKRRPCDGPERGAFFLAGAFFGTFFALLQRKYTGAGQSARVSNSKLKIQNSKSGLGQPTCSTHGKKPSQPKNGGRALALRAGSVFFGRRFLWFFLCAVAKKVHTSRAQRSHNTSSPPPTGRPLTIGRQAWRGRERSLPPHYCTNHHKPLFSPPSMKNAIIILTILLLPCICHAQTTEPKSPETFWEVTFGQSMEQTIRSIYDNTGKSPVRIDTYGKANVILYERCVWDNRLYTAVYLRFYDNQLCGGLADATHNSLTFSSVTASMQHIYGPPLKREKKPCNLEIRRPG